jgi:hypothetical protein
MNMYSALRVQVFAKAHSMPPPIVHKLVSLLERLAMNEAAVTAVNSQRPAGCPHLQTAEDIARGTADFEQQHLKKSGTNLFPSLPRLVHAAKLPKVLAAYGYPFAWPPENPHGSARPPGVPDHYVPILERMKKAQ